MSRPGQRVHLVPGYLLHQRPFRDSSLIVELFTPEFGRLSSFARAARGARTRFLGLQPFRPLLLSWSGRGEAPSLVAAEPDDPAVSSLPSACLLSGFYLNELLLKLTVPHDPHPELYAQYAATLAALRSGAPQETALRQFEKRLLDLLGFGSDLSHEWPSGRMVRSDSYYHFVPGQGVHAALGPAPQAGEPLARGAAPAAEWLAGRVLLALAADQIPEGAADQKSVRALLRAALDHCLEGRELSTRAVARAVARWERVHG